MFLGSENREVRAGQHHQEGLLVPYGQVNERGRTGRDPGWRQGKGMDRSGECWLCMPVQEGYIWEDGLGQ